MDKIVEIINKIFFSRVLIVIATLIIITLIIKKYREFQNYKEEIKEEIVESEALEEIIKEEKIEETVEEKAEEVEIEEKKEEEI